MNKEQYPECIYCDATWIEHTADGQLATCDGNFNSIRQKREDADNVEYTRADIYGWRMTEESLPQIVDKSRFSKTVLVVDIGGYCGTAYYCKNVDGTYSWRTTDENLSVMQIIAWMPIPTDVRIPELW